MSAAFETILLDISESIATITLNRPEKMNAYNRTMAWEVMRALDATDANDEVRAVIITGAGDRAFCAGADLSGGDRALDVSEMSNTRQQVGDVVRDSGGMLSLRIFQNLKPIIAAVNGAAVGIGLTMQLPMDIRIASTKAKFGFVFARRGIVPEAASSWFLPRIVGISTALEWCYSGRVFLAQEALERGLVRSLHAPEELIPAARAIAREIADNTSAVSVSLARTLMWRGLCSSHPMEAHMADSRATQARGGSHDAREGINSFLQKRPARYQDRVSIDLPNVFPFWDEPEFR